MATEQGRRLSFSKRTALKNVVRLIPAAVIIAVMLNLLSCGEGGLLSSDDNSGSPTATPTGTTATLAFVTNFNDGLVSSFHRNTTTGVLTWSGQVSAGAKKGPRGVVASPDGSFLYVANINDDNIYEYSINSNGTLTKLSPAFVSNGTGTQPDELATVATSQTLLWVTGKAGTIKSYTIGSTGQITWTSTTAGGGLQTPFGITVHPTLPVLYVSDSTTGYVYPFNYNPTTGALAPNSSPQHSTDPSANSPFAIAIDSGGDALFIADQALGEVSSFYIGLTTGVTWRTYTLFHVPEQQHKRRAGGSRNRGKHRRHRVPVHGQLGHCLGVVVHCHQPSDRELAAEPGDGLHRGHGVGGGSAEHVRLHRELLERHRRAGNY